MAFQKLYTFTGGNYDKTFTVDIYRDVGGTITVDTVEMLSVKYRIGSEETQIDYPFIANIWTFEIQDENYTNNGYIYDQLNNNPVNEFRVDVREGSNLIFRGMPSDVAITRDYDPVTETYNFSFKAVDGFGSLRGNKDLTANILAYDYESIQEILDTIGHGFDTRYYIDLDNQDNANSFLPDQFDLSLVNQISGELTLDYYEILSKFLDFYGLRIYQTEGRWHIIQENYIGTVGTERTYNYYQVDTSTYNTSTGTTIYDNAGLNNRYQEYNDEDFEDNVKVSIFDTLSGGSIKYYVANLDPIDGSNLDTLDNETLLPDESQTAGWKGVYDLDDSELSPQLSFTISLNVNYAADPILPVGGAKDFNVDLVEYKWVSLEGTDYWFNESENWVSSQAFWSVQLSTDSDGNKVTPLDDSISVGAKLVDLPPDAGGTGYIEVTILVDVTQTAGTTGGDPNDAVDDVDFVDIDGALSEIADYYNVFGEQPATGDTTDRDFTEITHDSNGGGDYNWRSDKDRFKLADTILTARLARQYKPLTIFKGRLNQFINPKFEALYGVPIDNNKDFKIHSFNGNLFEEQAQVNFIEYAYDESNITLQRGIYTDQ